MSAALACAGTLCCNCMIVSNQLRYLGSFLRRPDQSRRGNGPPSRTPTTFGLTTSSMVHLTVLPRALDNNIEEHCQHGVGAFQVHMHEKGLGRTVGGRLSLVRCFLGPVHSQILSTSPHSTTCRSRGGHKWWPTLKDLAVLSFVLFHSLIAVRPGTYYIEPQTYRFLPGMVAEEVQSVRKA